MIPQLSQREAWPVLRRNLCVLALGGADPRELLAQALAMGSIDDAADHAAVLDHRIDPAGTHSAGIGVLRWLPAIPPALAGDPQWGAYLARREHLVETLAEEIRDRARGWTHATAPGWARPLITVNTALTAEIAVFRAAIGVQENDTRLTGARQYPVRTRAVQATLQRHAAAGIGRRSADTTTRWNDLIDTIDPRLRADAYWPQLAAHLARATRTTPDLRQIITTAAHQKPLPDELPAAALWWRIFGAVSSTATLATTHSRLRPAWITDLDGVFGAILAETIAADLHWPGLVAAINAADPNTWTPRDLLYLAAEHLADITDEADPIPPGDYARLITYTVDTYTHQPPAAALHNFAEPHDAPPSPDEEDFFPPDPQLPAFNEEPAVPDVDAPLPADVHTVENGTVHFEGLRFDQLSTQRPPRELPITMELITQLRQEYRSVCNAITVLKADIAAGNGPSMRAADQDLARMRQRIDADRPYGHAVATVMAQWSDADAAYNDSTLLLEHARTRLLALTSTPGADEIDIASAQQELAFYTELLPDQPPSAQYQQALAQAQAARSAAAGGPIVTEHDIIAARDVAEAADRATLHELRTHRQALHDRLQRAESDIAAAFDTAHTRATQTLEQLLDTAYCEVNLLRSARHLDTKAAPLRMPESALSQHDPAIATRLNALAAQPYRLGYVHADSTDPDTAAALRTLRTAAHDSNRKILWISASDNAAAIAQDSGVADTYTTIGDDLADKLWSPGPDAIVIIDNPATIDPEQLAITTNYITTNGARAIILNPADGHIGPATSALRLLATST